MIKLAIPLLSLVVGLTFVGAPIRMDGPAVGAAVAFPDDEVGEIREVEMDLPPGEDGDVAPAEDAPVAPDPVKE